MSADRPKKSGMLEEKHANGPGFFSPVNLTLKEEVVKEFYQNKLIHFIEHKLTFGASTPVYVDLRMLSSHPKLLKNVALLYQEKLQALQFHKLCGVPLGGIPITTAISLVSDLPAVLLRKEKKAHGTGKTVEGEFAEGEKCLVIEDVTTTGGSLLNAATQLRNEKLLIGDAMVFIDTERGAEELLKKNNIALQPVFKFSEFLDVLTKVVKLNPAELEAIEATKLTMQPQVTADQPNPPIRSKL